MSKGFGAVAILALLLAWPAIFPMPVEAQGPGGPALTIIGRAVDEHGMGIPEASVRVLVDGKPRAILVEGREEDQAQTLSDGSFVLRLSLPEGELRAAREGRVEITLALTKPSYAPRSLDVKMDQIAQMRGRLLVDVGEVVLERHRNAAFFIATATFIVVLALISLGVIHETMASLAGAVLLLAVTYMAGAAHPDFYILDFEDAVESIDFDAIFLVMAMMIMVALIGKTGVFRWLAFVAYRVARGRVWYLAALLTVIAALASAFLDNVTVMLLMTPITIEIALIMGIHPSFLIIPEMFSSNIGGTATLVGGPPCIMVGSYAGLGFSDFLIHMTPIAFISTAVLIVMLKLLYGREYEKARAGASPAMLKKLEADSRITDPVLLRKALITFGLTIVLFLIGDLFHMPPCVAALIGATTLLIWVRPPFEEMLKEVSWTTLLFFIALFIMAGGIGEVGLIQMAAEAIEQKAGDNLALATTLVTWLSGLASGVIGNVPFTAAMLPLVSFLTKGIPGAESGVLYWALVVGACFGGNFTVIGSESNMVAASLADQAGYRISFGDFLKVGIPVTIATILSAMIWLLIRY